MKNARQTNIKFITHIMNHSAHGALMQAFILEACGKYSANVVANEQALRESMKDSFITPDAWVGCAKELAGLLDKRFTQSS